MHLGMSLALARQAPYPVRTHQRRCGKCGKLVSRAAYACRRCGKAQKIQPRTILALTSGALLIAMFSVAASGSMSQARSAEVVPPVFAHPGKSASPVPEINASDLWGAYSRDRPAADRVYRDRSLAVSGMVRSIDRDFEGNMVVRLGTGDVFDTVNATFATRNDPALAVVVKGRPISLLCVGRGALMGAPLLSGCFVR
jgi:hypothetical protein